MNVKASFYDIFAYTIPGGMFLMLVIHALKIFEFGNYLNILLESNLFVLLTFGFLSHVVGFLIDPITYYLFGNFKTKEKSYLIAYKEVLNRNPKLEDVINPADWAIWFAKIKKESTDAGSEIDQFLAYSKMMRGVCLTLFLSGILMFTYVLLGKITISYLLSIPFIILFFILGLRQAKKFKLGFYMLIFETVFSRRPPFTQPDELKPNK